MINTLYIDLFIILVAGIITLTVLLYREKFTPAPTLAASQVKPPDFPFNPIERTSPILFLEDLLLCDKDGNIFELKTDEFESYLEKVNMVLTNWGMALGNRIVDPYIPKFPTLAALPNSPIPGGQNLLLSDEKGNLNIVKTDDFNSYLTNVNTALTKWSTEFAEWDKKKPISVPTPLAALPIPDGQNLILSDQINNDLIEWSTEFAEWIYDVKLWAK